VYVRAERTSSSKVVTHLESGDTVTLVVPKSAAGYYQVKTAGGDEGFAWAARLKLVAGSSADSTTPAGIATGSVDPTWTKSPTNAVEFTWPDTHGTCAADGSGNPGHFDPETNVWKNRTDIPSAYHDVNWDALAALPVPRDSTQYRTNWAPSDLAVLARYEGIPVRVVAFLSGAKQEIPGTKKGVQQQGESTNCGENSTEHVDWHLYLTRGPQQPKHQAVVVETTPRMRLSDATQRWDFSVVNGVASASDSVRVSGWLMFDPEHYDQMYKYDPADASTASKYRITLWEIHPITDIEVWRGGRWCSLIGGSHSGSPAC
jgi:hypothetical protein